MEIMVTIKELENTYSGKRVFLTGHTGFKGSWMLKLLSLIGAEIKGYALSPNTPNDLFNKINGECLCNSVIADLRDRDKLISEINSFKPDFIFHFAAQPLVRLSYDLPVETFDTNVIGTANLLEGVRGLKDKCSIVLITTDKVYYNNEWEYPYRENDRLGGYDPYSGSKACMELLIDSFRKSFFNPINYESHLKGVAVARAGNVIGGGDWSKDRLIPDIVRSLSTCEPIIIRNPKSIRPWQHVLEPIIGYLILGMQLELEPSSFSQSYNFGPNLDDALSVEDMVKLAINEWGYGDYIIQNEINQRHEAHTLKLDISKAKDKLKWYPKMNAKEAVRMTIDWYKLFGSADMNIATTNQILNFLSLH